MNHLTITVRTNADPGDTSNVAPDTDWQGAGRDYIDRLAAALRSACPDATIDVALHDLDTDTIVLTDDDGPLYDDDERIEHVRETVGGTWGAWVESLPSRDVRDTREYAEKTLHKVYSAT